jgi:hypothetical protein
MEGLACIFCCRWVLILLRMDSIGLMPILLICAFRGVSVHTYSLGIISIASRCPGQLVQKAPVCCNQKYFVGITAFCSLLSLTFPNSSGRYAALGSLTSPAAEDCCLLCCLHETLGLIYPCCSESRLHRF